MSGPQSSKRKRETSNQSNESSISKYVLSSWLKKFLYACHRLLLVAPNGQKLEPLLYYVVATTRNHFAYEYSQTPQVTPNI